jgi:hypothetical protein
MWLSSRFEEMNLKKGVFRGGGGPLWLSSRFEELNLKKGLFPGRERAAVAL